ncbi:hypothetical protein AAHX86_19370 [Klebsiella pneumoniae]
MTDITELAQRLKLEVHRAVSNFNPQMNIKTRDLMELVEALASEKRICATWRKTAEANSEKLEKAQTINAAAEKLVRCKGRYHSEQNYRALAALFGVKTPDLPTLERENVHYADAVGMEIAALRQRIAELESRTVTVKLPYTPEPSAFAPWAAKAFYQFHKDTVKSCVAVFSDACAAAGIKVEAE